MSKDERSLVRKLFITILILAGISFPLYWWDAKVLGRWDSDGVLISLSAIAIVLLEPPISFAIRSYLAWRRSERERIKREREAALRESREREARRKRLEAEEAEAETIRRRTIELANAEFAARRKAPQGLKDS